MITDKKVASEINSLMLELGKKLDESVALAESACPEDEFVRYRSIVGELMGIALLDVMNPLYKTHPELKPKELK